jgi:hypothetical protein
MKHSYVISSGSGPNIFLSTPLSNTSAYVSPMTRDTKFYNRTKQEKSFIQQTGRQNILDRTAAGVPRIHLLFILLAHNFYLLELFPNI